MSTVQQAIEVHAPLHTVYEQLATFESYPQFMTGVEQVTQISNDQTHWVMDLDGQRREFDAMITECSLDERVSWSTMDGPLLAETITLRPIGETRTQVVAQLEADVASLMPSDRHGQASLTKRLKADLAGFKRLIEQDGDAVSRQLTGTSTIATGQGGAGLGAAVKHLDPSSPAAVAARATRNRAAAARSAGDAGMGTGGMSGDAGMAGTEMAGSGMSGTGMAGTGMNDTGMADAGMSGPDAELPGAQIGAAGMGGRTMSPRDAWGDATINEEERGSAHDI
ncbi:MAG TPA: SRPBCC family protein [Actinoplanes sp.]|nr:SRPBCC family protein [Actinoplanes sp.]